MNLKRSLKHSCDVYYYETAEKTSIDQIHRVGKELGLGEAYDLPFTNLDGNMPSKAWKKKVYGEDWLVGDTINIGIGQGFLLCTPLQLAVMTARIASGKKVTPQLVKSINGVRSSQTFANLPFKKEHLEAIRGGMFAVSNEAGGTARRTAINVDGQKWAGKTGTAQARNISKEERAQGVISNEDLEWAKRDHALFVAFAPYDNPKYAISVVVEHGGSGSATAAPIARDLMLYALYGGIPPAHAFSPFGSDFLENLPELNTRKKNDNSETSV